MFLAFVTKFFFSGHECAYYIFVCSYTFEIFKIYAYYAFGKEVGLGLTVFYYTDIPRGSP